MRRFFAILVFAMCLRAGGAERPAFQTLRYNEDWSFLRDKTQHTDFFDPAKYVPLDTNGNWYLSFGAEARLKYELYSKPVFNQKPADDNGFLLQRYLMHADIHATPYFCAFGQLQSSLEDFRNGGPRPTDRDDLDLHQAFFDASIPLNGGDAFTLRAGRQEMAYGSQRLISVRESPNNRLAFDAVRLLTKYGEWRADAWLSQPIEVDPGIFDDQRIDETTFWGGYITGPLPFIPGLKAISTTSASRGRTRRFRAARPMNSVTPSAHVCSESTTRSIGILNSWASSVRLAMTAFSLGRRRPTPAGRLPKRPPRHARFSEPTSLAATTAVQISARSTRCFRAVPILTKPR